MRISPVSFNNSYRNNNVNNNHRANKNNISFGFFDTPEAELRARNILTAPPTNKGIQDCYDGWFNEMKDASELQIYVDENNELNYEYDRDLREDPLVSGLLQTRSRIPSLKEPHQFQGLAVSLYMARRKLKGLEPVDLLPDSQSVAAEMHKNRMAMQEWMRMDALAK